MDDIDLGILYLLDLNSRRSVNDIAKRLGEKTEKIHYRLKNLYKDGLVRRYYAEVDPWKVGYTSYKVYLQFQGVDSEKIAEMYDFLKKSCSVNWVASCLGRWDMVIDVLAEDRHEFNAIYSRFHSRYYKYILAKVIGVTLDFTFMNKKWLAPGKYETSISFMKGNPCVLVDKKDILILNRLVTNAREPVRQIAKEIGMPQTTVSQRINRMIKEKIILNFRADINLSSFKRIFCKAFIYFSAAPEEELLQLFDYCYRHPDVTFINRSIAPWDMEIEAHSISFTDFTNMLNELKNKFPHVIRNFEAVVINKGTASFHTIPQKS